MILQVDESEKISIAKDLAQMRGLLFVGERVDLDVKKILLITLPLLLIVGCSTSQKEYDINHIVKLNGVYVKEINDEIVNGEVFQVVDDMKVPIGKMKNGKKDGLWTSWYENGQKESEETFKDGKRDGLGTWWYENGQKKDEFT